MALAEPLDVTPPPGRPAARSPLRHLGVVFWLSIGWIGLTVFAALFADILPIRPPNELGIRTGDVARLEGPGWNAWFGGDQQGKDVFSNVVHGARPALILGVLVTAISSISAGCSACWPATSGGGSTRPSWPWSTCRLPFPG